MILAAFGAIHGDLRALDRALEAVDQEGVQTLVCTGNLADGPDPDEVIERLRMHQVHVVQGDRDRLLARLVRKRKRLEREVDPQTLARLEQAHRRCGSANLEWLAGLPHVRSFKVDGEPVVLFNGTIASAAARIRPDDSDEVFRRQREAALARVYVFDGSAGPFVRTIDGAVFANPGALLAEPGCVSYMLVSTEEDEPTAVSRTVPYDSVT